MGLLYPSIFKHGVGNGFVQAAEVCYIKQTCSLDEEVVLGETEDSTSFFQNVCSVTAVSIQFILLTNDICQIKYCPCTSAI
jgi:hypothetical protein